MAHETMLSVIYDKPVDVMHLILGDPQSYEGDGLYNGVEIDYSLETGKVCGAKIIGFSKYGWEQNLDELAEVIGRELSIKHSQVLEALSSAR